MPLIRGVLLAALTSTVLQAQQADTARRGEIGGTVFDSLSRAPIAGAIVQAVAAANQTGKVYSAVTNAAGRYVLSGLRAERYIVEFEHEALDSLSLASPVRLVDLKAGDRTTVDLAVPSARTILRATCGPGEPSDSSGLLIGMLRDSRTRTPLDTGSVALRWHDLLIQRGSFSFVQRSANAVVRKDGWFALCGVPGGVEVIAFATVRQDSTGFVRLVVPVQGLTRRDFFLGGNASVRGIVVSDRAQPIGNARVTLLGLDRSVTPDSSGEFALRDLPAGSQTLEVRALGYAPESRPLDLSPGVDTSLRVTLTPINRLLDTIRVVAQRVYDRDSNGFLRRKRMGGGYFFDEKTVERQHPVDLYSLLQRAPSVSVQTQGFERHVLLRGGAAGYCTPMLYVNGAKMPAELLGDLDLLARPDELAGIEVYRGINTPPQFTGFSSCGAIVIWTRPSQTRR